MPEPESKASESTEDYKRKLLERVKAGYWPNAERAFKKAHGIPLTGRKNDNPEARVNQAIKEWLTLHRVFFFRVNTMGTPLPGGGFRPASTRGISDFICILPGGKFCGLEAKSDVGRQSEDQKRFQEAVENAGGRYFIIRSVDDLEAFLKPLLAK